MDAQTRIYAYAIISVNSFMCFSILSLQMPSCRQTWTPFAMGGTQTLKTTINPTMLTWHHGTRQAQSTSIVAYMSALNTMTGAMEGRETKVWCVGGGYGQMDEWCVCVCVRMCVGACSALMIGISLQASFWLTRICEEAMALITALLSTHVRIRMAIAVVTSVLRRETTIPTGIQTLGRTSQCSSKTHPCVTSTQVRVIMWSRGASATRGADPCHDGTTRRSVRLTEVG